MGPTWADRGAHRATSHLGGHRYPTDPDRALESVTERNPRSWPSPDLAHPRGYPQGYPQAVDKELVPGTDQVARPGKPPEVPGTPTRYQVNQPGNRPRYQVPRVPGPRSTPRRQTPRTQVVEPRTPAPPPQPTGHPQRLLRRGLPHRGHDPTPFTANREPLRTPHRCHPTSTAAPTPEVNHPQAGTPTSPKLWPTRTYPDGGR